MSKKKEYDLDKLGTVLAISNEITRDTLGMLKEQQRRQVRMIWSSMAIVAMAICVVGLAIYMTFSSLDRLTDRIEHFHGGAVIENQQKESKGVS